MNEAIITEAELAEKFFEPSDIGEVISFPTRYLRFTRFELDLHQQRLRCAGVSVNVPHKVFRTLVVLLQQPGKIVSREILCNHLWPENNGIDVESNLNTTLNKLRRIFRDMGAVHPLIQTIARRGYLFTAKVEYAERVMSEDPRTQTIEGKSLRFRCIQAVKVFFLERSSTCLKASLIVLVIASILLGAAITLYAYRPIYHP